MDGLTKASFSLPDQLGGFPAIFCAGDSWARASGLNNRAIRPAAKVNIILLSNPCIT
jgi:hypothetical protein